MLKIDHVTIAGERLDKLQRAFAQIGLTPDYGGPHSNQITHMALVGFDDGSYIELISRMEKGQESPWWHQHIVQDGGACAWAIQVDDITREAERIAAHGIKVRGPEPYHRERSGGKLVQWDLAFLGDYEPGSKLPFLIADRTPRSFRVQPSASVTGNDLTGVRKVVLGVRNLSAASREFMRVFAWSAPESEIDPLFGAELAAFPGQPVILAQPTADNWLEKRLDKFGESPCACLLHSRDWNASVGERNLAPGRAWFQSRVAWFDLEGLAGTRLGVMAD